jgi:23S rRNA (adenine1618-N6)-methyltransferase
MQGNREKRDTKEKLHPRNKHRERYNFRELCKSSPELTAFVKRNEYGDESIDFFNPAAVKILNAALLKYFYKIEYWEIPGNYLTPPVPGRADYIHYLADLLSENNRGEIPTGKKIKGLDIGTGANCIYPVIGVAAYGWSFVGTDIDTAAIDAAAKIVALNSVLKGKVDLRLQQNKNHIFSGILTENERFDFTICNPPFHASADEAQAGTIRKLRNLKRKNVKRATLNFGGQSNELWCEGGEVQFITNMIRESKQFRDSCLWFTTLVSKESNLTGFYKTLKSVGAAKVKTIPMGQGNKTSRLLAWSFSRWL